MREDPRHAIALVTVRWIFIDIVMLILFGFVALLRLPFADEQALVENQLFGNTGSKH